MKINIVLFFIFIFSNELISQVPNNISFQAIVRDNLNNGNLIINKDLNIKISILKDSISGSIVFEETHKVKTNSYGLITILIGQGQSILGRLENIPWHITNYFIKTEYGFLNSNVYFANNITQLLSVPYAFHSKTSDSFIGNPFKQKRYIGEYYGGGVIFQLDQDSLGNQHGLIVAIKDIRPSIAWSNVELSLDNPNQRRYKSFDGLQNSIDIVNQPGHIASCAKLCLDYNYDGYDDWYLPSIDELRLLSDQRYNVNKTLYNIPNSEVIINAGYYWSSTSTILSNTAYYFNMELDISDPAIKSKLHSIRPIRKF
jgi:hypothetical protein